ncbi:MULTISPECIES: hypothetical protein [Clostridium]|uniref:hypothetical protein n=1 Tax=Clostridium TaxID=1485 RepID=UPI0008265219|nr:MULTISPECIES: hypothetical protein [Clostridium]PJI08477.1 hypothetical protein CUB90_11650 [Clostridium sp. CT7]
MKKNYYRNITILGLLLSIVWIIAVNTQPYSDFQYYNELAKKIASGGAWGDTYTSVGYSIVLGFVYKIFGTSLITAKVFNICLTAFNYLIVYWILEEINISERKRKIIYGIFVLFPNNIFYNSITGTEILFVTVFLIMTLVYLGSSKYKYIILGALTAAAAMIKPFFILFFFAVFVIELLLKNKFLDVIKHSILIFAISMVCLSPWLYRNSKLMGQFTFISNNNGIVLYINNNSQNHTGLWMDAKNVENSIVTKKSYIKANDTEKNKMLSAAAKKWIVNHPGQFIILGFKRLFNTYFSCSDISYSFYGSSINPSVQMLLAILANDVKIFIFAIAVISIIAYSLKVIYSLINKRELDKFSIYNLIIFYMVTCTYFVTEGQPRYSFPVIFIAICFSVNGTNYIVDWIKKKHLGNS